MQILLTKTAGGAQGKYPILQRTSRKIDFTTTKKTLKLCSWWRLCDDDGGHNTGRFYEGQNNAVPHACTFQIKSRSREQNIIFVHWYTPITAHTGVTDERQRIFLGRVIRRVRVCGWQHIVVVVSGRDRQRCYNSCWCACVCYWGHKNKWKRKKVAFKGTSETAKLKCDAHRGRRVVDQDLKSYTITTSSAARARVIFASSSLLAVKSHEKVGSQ